MRTKAYFFNGDKRFFKQESEIGSFKQFCFKSINLSKVERNSESNNARISLLENEQKSNRS